MIKKNDKKAWIRILESGIAVMLMIGFFSILAMKHISLPDISDEVYQLEREVLKEVSENENVRMAVLTGDAETAYEFIQRRLSPYVSSAIRICDSDEACTFPVENTPDINSYYPTNLQMPTQNVYSDDYLISTCLSSECAGLPPQLLRLFVWFDKREDYQQPPVIYLCGNSQLDTEEQCDLSAPAPNLKESKCKAFNPSYVLGSLGCTAVDDDDPCKYIETGCDKCDKRQITFKDTYPQNDLNSITFYASKDVNVPNGGVFSIKVYDLNENIIGSQDNFPTDQTILDTTLFKTDLNKASWPSAGSLITIEYNGECQDFFRVGGVA